VISLHWEFEFHVHIKASPLAIWAILAPRTQLVNLINWLCMPLDY
jgi:hypothetical protein